MDTKTSLTETQFDICRFIETFQQQNQMTPSMQEIARHFGWSGRAAAHSHVNRICKKGYLEKRGDAGASRRLCLTHRWAALRSRETNKLTNPVVDEVADERPELFQDWSQGDWDQLYSIRGMGGSLTKDGVVHHATRINEDKEIDRMVDDLKLIDIERDQLIAWLKEHHANITPGKGRTTSRLRAKEK